jgi:hypothetical protein
MIPRAEAERRDALLRAYIVGRDWELDGEQTLRRDLVVASRTLLPRYPLLVGVEWRAPDGSQGDLLFFDGGAAFAVVEVKHLGDRERTARRGTVERQARRYAGDAASLFPGAAIEALVYTCDEQGRGLPPRQPERL